ncbi:MAG: PmoA family protein [Planctomycetales bacterium]|nr:PmoA family protein [Planctomycetales bacterium]
MRLTKVLALAALAYSVPLTATTAWGAETKLRIKPTENGMVIIVKDQPVATFFAADKKVFRPFYAHVFTPDGKPITRNYPPKAGEPADHADMHPGIWLAFADLNGHDFWRNKGRVKSGKLLADPEVTDDGITFTVRNDYVAALKDGEKVLARETCRHSWSVQEGGLLLSLDSELESADPNQPLVFGDQEEMGLGVRVATPLRVKDAGGEIRTSDGKRNEKEAWGKQARWCDYSGNVDGRRVGITLMPHPGNFRESWFHVRDYGLMVANPFGQNAFTGKEKSHLEVKPGEKLRLRFGVRVHSGKETSDKKLESEYQSYVKRAGK